MKNELWEGFRFPGEYDREIEIFEGFTENYRKML